jgi:KDO2-lipid IV(A) lauroyltransferase
VRHTSPDRWAGIAAWIMRHLGPRLRAHRYAVAQIALAFPEKAPAEHNRIAIGMWDNLTRTVVEYAQLDRLWDHDPARPGQGRILMDPASVAVWRDIRSANRRTLHFSLHCANWELAAIAVAKHGVRALIPYRRLKVEAATDEIVRIRTAAGTTPLTAGPSMISEVKREFGAKPGDVLGMLIDQRYAHGIEVEFFGRPTLLNPLFARLARIYDCPIYGSRIIRRPDGRFGYEIVPVEPVRDARGRVDVPATTQRLASIMEKWIRDCPEQWMWLHRTWR